MKTEVIQKLDSLVKEKDPVLAMLGILELSKDIEIDELKRLYLDFEAEKVVLVKVFSKFELGPEEQAKIEKRLADDMQGKKLFFVYKQEEALTDLVEIRYLDKLIKLDI